MKILFFMRSTIYARNLESTLRLLAHHGHEVHVLADEHSLPESNELVARLCREHERIHYRALPAVPPSPSSYLGLELRRAIDYLRYLGPEFAESPKLRARATRTAPAFVTQALGRPLVDSGVGRRVLAWLCRLADRAVPADPQLEDFIRAESPDLVLVTPLVEPGAPQAEYLRAARACGVRTGLCVYSWDNLTNKGLIQDPLDLVTVWNEPMKREAVRLHGVPPERVVVTGSPAYDHWFDWKPRLTREAFCVRVGLRADRPYLLYLCSSKFIAPDEVPFIRRWIGDLRASARLRDVGVLVRPHPQNVEQWETADLGDLDAVAVWPRAGGSPVDQDSRADYYDSIYHSAAVVGVNTSAQIESAIVGRGVYTVLADEFRDTQEGTLHFRHLRDANGGLLHVAKTMAEHVEQLETAVSGTGDDVQRCRRFVEGFVRPHGLHEAGAPRVVSALETVAARGVAAPDRGPWWRPLARPVVTRLAARLWGSESSRREKARLSERFRQRQETARSAERAAQAVAKRQVADRRDAKRRDAAAMLAAEREQCEAAAERVRRQYPEIKRWIDRWREARLPDVSLSAAERQLSSALAGFDEGRPEVLTGLRRWCEPITGVRAADYEPLNPAVKNRLKGYLSVQHRPEAQGLFVPESPLLGGFGYTKRGYLYNEDTLRHYTTLVALQDAALLSDLRGRERRLVWEIGGEWGGLARQLKTVCPAVTYVISAAPEQLLVSALYLSTLFPQATVRYFDPSAPCALFEGWPQCDFVFVPEAALSLIRAPRLDLVVDAMALHRMSQARVALHIGQAHEWGVRYFYSRQPGPLTAAEASAVSEAMSRGFWVHAIPAPTIPEGTGTLARAAEAERSDDVEDAHLVGWRRLFA